MRTNSIILSFLMVFALGFGAFAQDWGNTSPEEKARWETDRLKNELDLSDMQTEEVERITLQKHQELSNLIMDTENIEMAERASQITSSWDSEMQAILNESQIDEYVDVKEEFIEDDLESVEMNIKEQKTDLKQGVKTKKKEAKTNKKDAGMKSTTDE